jgi:uncharacterized membrane protein
MIKTTFSYVASLDVKHVLDISSCQPYYQTNLPMLRSEAEARSLVQQATDEFDLAESLANQGKWEEGVNHLRTASNLADEAYAKEQIYLQQQQQEQEQREQEQQDDILKQQVQFYNTITVIVVVLVIVAVIGVVLGARARQHPALANLLSAALVDSFFP